MSGTRDIRKRELNRFRHEMCVIREAYEWMKTDTY